MRIIIVALLFMLTATSAVADNVANIALGCAPWDGRAFDVTVGWPESTAIIHIWGKGLEQLSGGKATVLIDNNSSSDGTGSAQICNTRSAKVCNFQNITVEFTAVEVKAGARAEGSLKLLNGGTIPFNGTVSTKKNFCG